MELKNSWVLPKNNKLWLVCQIIVIKVIANTGHLIYENMKISGMI